jgi:DNA repair exonuclease SbcCD ATPase subunit
MKFKHVRFKNILSFGNQWTEFDLDLNQTVLITGTNGMGKSSLLEVIYFAYTGKPYRNINKGKLVNNINKKNLLVELTIEHMNSVYMIRRGIKPNIFEIFKDIDVIDENSKPIDEDSNIKDYQKQLETILGIDHKTFKQTIMMSARHYTPFLELKPQEKREFIENIFSLKMFSHMNDSLKKKLSSTKLNIKDLEKDVEHVLSNIQVLTDLNEKQMKHNKEQLNVLESEINDLIENNKNNEDNIANNYLVIAEKNEKLVKLQNKLKLKAQVVKKANELEYKINDYKSKVNYLESNDLCDNCGQGIDEDFKETNIRNLTFQMACTTVDFEKINNTLNTIEKINQSALDIIAEVNKYNQEIMVLNSRISGNNTNITQKKKAINNINDTVLINKEDVDALNNKHTELNANKIKLKAFQKYVTLTIELISDKGIKKFIISKYIPVLNNLLNKYLKRFEATYSVVFNEELEESVIARGYDDLSYENLSSGEKQRLDASVVFSFLELCRLKNSVNTNLLIFDEILDSALDAAGIAGILRIFDEMKAQGYTIFVVSHRPGSDEYFDKIFKISKKQFSEIEEII